MVESRVYVSVVVPVSSPIRRAPHGREVVQEVEDGRPVIVVDPGRDRERARRAPVGDDGQTLAYEFGDHRVLVGGVDDDRSVQRDVGPHVVPGGGREDHEGVATGERGRGGGSRHLREVRELGEGERFIPVRGHGQADEPRLAGTEGSGRRGRAVTQPFCDLADMAAGGIREPALAVEGVGHGRDGDPGRRGDVPDPRPSW